MRKRCYSEMADVKERLVYNLLRSGLIPPQVEKKAPGMTRQDVYYYIGRMAKRFNLKDWVFCYMAMAGGSRFNSDEAFELVRQKKIYPNFIRGYSPRKHENFLDFWSIKLEPKHAPKNTASQGRSSQAVGRAKPRKTGRNRS